MQFGVAIVVGIGVFVGLLLAWKMWQVSMARWSRQRSAKVLDEIEMEFVNDELDDFEEDKQ